ncbi:hypothetical protein SETIT_1G308700v2 [Setaria italica]|uniref:Uncharacterized protein n=1 Tax=Setaria italica TaxID=4555 RepID=A0A368PRU9_SETIT|nr:hypothetical protein SETIT_1G308700v2 [Setaria italica]
MTPARQIRCPGDRIRRPRWRIYEELLHQQLVSERRALAQMSAVPRRGSSSATRVAGGLTGEQCGGGLAGDAHGSSALVGARPNCGSAGSRAAEDERVLAAASVGSAVAANGGGRVGERRGGLRWSGGGAEAWFGKVAGGVTRGRGAAGGGCRPRAGTTSATISPVPTAAKLGSFDVRCAGCMASRAYNCGGVVSRPEWSTQGMSATPWRRDRDAWRRGALVASRAHCGKEECSGREEHGKQLRGVSKEVQVVEGAARGQQWRAGTETEVEVRRHGEWRRSGGGASAGSWTSDGGANGVVPSLEASSLETQLDSWHC